MTSSEIRKKFLEFFKKNGHTIVPSSSLIPDDPSVLLTTAGMQQFKPYYSELDPETTIHLSIGKPIGKNAVSVQKCFRTSDIDEVGDESHLTFFEMLGNFSFGGYFKKEAIQYGYDFIIKEMGLEIDYVSIFDPKRVPVGDWRKDVPFDKESHAIWKKFGIPEDKIVREGVDVFWGPTGNEGPCGPTTEIYVKSVGGKVIEIWNIVFNEFYCDKNKKLTRLKTPGVDTGMGLERLAMAVQKKETIFETDLFASVMAPLPEKMEVRTRRILSDHIRGIVFLVSDGVRPSNKETGYVLRRLMRRVMVHFYTSGDAVKPEYIFGEIFENYENFYPELNREVVLEEFAKENKIFYETLDRGLKEFENIVRGQKMLNGRQALYLYQSFGLPRDVMREMVISRGIEFGDNEFEEEFKKHQEISRAGSEKKFGGHGLILDTGELKAGNEEELKKVTRLHTATHLLQRALREVLGDEVQQRGSDITTERTRFDFSFPRKLIPEEIKKIEDIVNEKIKEDLPVGFKEMPKSEAEKTDALFFFKAKYPEKVKVYYVGRSLEAAFSKEFCGGPHVARTGEIGKLRIIKEEPVAAGVRRIRATVE